MKTKAFAIVMTMVLLVILSGFSGYFIGRMNTGKTETTNQVPEIIDMWITDYHYPYVEIGRTSNVSVDIWPPYPYRYYIFNIEVKDKDDDVMSITFYIKENNHWVKSQEYFGRDGIYSMYPYYYKYPVYTMLKGYMKIPEVKVIISDNTHTVSKIFHV